MIRTPVQTVRPSERLLHFSQRFQDSIFLPTGSHMLVPTPESPTHAWAVYSTSTAGLFPSVGPQQGLPFQWVGTSTAPTAQGTYSSGFDLRTAHTNTFNVGPAIDPRLDLMRVYGYINAGSLNATVTTVNRLETASVSVLSPHGENNFYGVQAETQSPVYNRDPGTQMGAPDLFTYFLNPDATRVKTWYPVAILDLLNFSSRIRQYAKNKNGNEVSAHLTFGSAESTMYLATQMSESAHINGECEIVSGSVPPYLTAWGALGLGHGCIWITAPASGVYLSLGGNVHASLTVVPDNSMYRQILPLTTPLKPFQTPLSMPHTGGIGHNSQAAESDSHESTASKIYHGIGSFISSAIDGISRLASASKDLGEGIERAGDGVARIRGTSGGTVTADGNVRVYSNVPLISDQSHPRVEEVY